MIRKKYSHFTAFFIVICCMMMMIPFQVEAQDTNLAVNEVHSGIVEENKFSYNLTNGVMTWIFHQDNAIITIEDGICIVDGDILSFDIFAGLFEEDGEENENAAYLTEWMNNNPIDQIIFSDNVRKLDTQLFSIWFFRDSSQILLGNGMEYIRNDAFNSYVQITTLTLPTNIQQIDDNAFGNCENLTDVTVLAKDVILDSSGIGYYCGKPLDDMTIRGYRNSSAETYANEHGFTFIVLDDDSDMMTTTTTLTTTDTTIMTTTDSTESTITTTKSTTTTTTNDGGIETTTTTATATNDGGIETTTTTATPATIASDEEFCDWAAKDYAEKTGITPENAEIEYIADGNAVITLTDADGSVLDVYNIDPFTGIGTEADGGDVNLPQTGYSNFYKVIVWFAILMTISGVAIVAYSRKESE